MAVARRLGLGLVLIGGLNGCGSQPDEPTKLGGGAGDATVAVADECPSLPGMEAGDAIEGDLIIDSQEDAAAARAISEIGGSLVITRSFPGVLDLPNLRRVGDHVRLQGDQVAGPESSWAAITELRLPHLERIDGELYLYLTGALVETDLRSLETVGGRVYYMRNLALRRIGLDALTSASVSIQASPLAASCEINAICERVGGVDCGAQYSSSECECVERCRRLELRCPG